jgi:uncharacterized protein DUF6647
MLKSSICSAAFFTIAVIGAINTQQPANSPSTESGRAAADSVPGGGAVSYQATAPSLALLAAIGTWLSVEFDLPTIHEPPLVELVSTAKITSLCYGGLLSTSGADIAANNYELVSAQGDTVAVYHDPTRTIYLPEHWTASTPADLSILIHEMIHHFQNVLALKHECPQEREKLAYIAQDRWLRLFGHTLENDFALDPFSVLVKTRCFY